MRRAALRPDEVIMVDQIKYTDAMQDRDPDCHRFGCKCAIIWAMREDGRGSFMRTDQTALEAIELILSQPRSEPLLQRESYLNESSFLSLEPTAA